MLKAAKEDNTQVFDLETDADCIRYENILKFFVKTKLTLDSEQRLKEFQTWKQQFSLLIKNA